jgi:hypothetical protein
MHGSIAVMLACMQINKAAASFAADASPLACCFWRSALPWQPGMHACITCEACKLTMAADLTAPNARSLAQRAATAARHACMHHVGMQAHCVS